MTKECLHSNWKDNTNISSAGEPIATAEQKDISQSRFKLSSKCVNKQDPVQITVKCQKRTKIINSVMQLERIINKTLKLGKLKENRLKITK